MAGCASQSSSVAITASVPVRQMNAMKRLSFNPIQLCRANHHFRWDGVADTGRRAGWLGRGVAGFMLALDG
ncbi:hypothetical protein D3C73_1572410 [compost metagenome]